MNIFIATARAFATTRQNRRAYGELVTLDDRSLADIGLQRTEIPGSFQEKLRRDSVDPRVLPCYQRREAYDPGAHGETPMAQRAWVLLRSGRRLNLLEPMASDWDDEDLALGLARTYRWGGHSAWELPLSVAQHSLTVLALRQAASPVPLTKAQALRELLHDAEEGFLSWDPIAPIKPYLGTQLRSLMNGFQEAIAQRYHLPQWTEAEYGAHKHADRLTAASEAFHVVGWSRAEIRDYLGIELDPLDVDPVPPPAEMRPWEPWPSHLAASLFLDTLKTLIA